MIRYFDLNHFNDFHLSSFLKIKSWNSWTVIKWCIEISIYCYRYRHIVSYSTVRKKYRPFSIYWDICFSHVDSVNNCFLRQTSVKLSAFRHYITLITFSQILYYLGYSALSSHHHTSTP